MSVRKQEFKDFLKGEKIYRRDKGDRYSNR